MAPIFATWIRKQSRTLHKRSLKCTSVIINLQKLKCQTTAMLSYFRDGRKGRLFLPTTKAHLAAAIAFANERNPGIQHLWTGWEKDPATKTVISSSRPGLTMPESLWVRPTEPNYPLRMSSSLQGGKYKEGCVVAVASGVGDVDCVTWARIMHRNPYAICEFF